MKRGAAPGAVIVVGVDGSASSIEALRWAVRQAELTGGSVRAVAARHWPPVWGWGIPLAPPSISDAEARQALDGVLAPVRAEHPGVAVEPVVVEAHPVAALVDASRDADLLVVGSRGHGGFAGMLLGSVSEHCATNAACPVLVYRTKG